MRCTVLVVSMLSSACLVVTEESQGETQQPQQHGDDVAATTPPLAQAQAAGCGAIGQACQQNTDCCAGTFCLDYTYVAASCTAPLPDGAACDADSQCQSGRCAGYECRSACVAEGSACTFANECCAGSYCFNWTYAPAVCKALLADGSSCEQGAQCVSGSCQGSRCSSACLGIGTECTIDADCCPGSYCFNWTYAPSVCKAAEPAGSPCHDDRHCASGSCRMYQCAP